MAGLWCGAAGPEPWPCSRRVAVRLSVRSGRAMAGSASMGAAWVGPLRTGTSGLGDTAASFPRGRRTGPGGELRLPGWVLTFTGRSRMAE